MEGRPRHRSAHTDTIWPPSFLSLANNHLEQFTYKILRLTDNHQQFRTGF